jgi:hypothetical protein
VSFPLTDISPYVRIDGINADAARGGWEMRLTALRDTDLLEANQNVVLGLRGMFGTGTPEATWRTAFDGHVIPIQFTFDRKASQATFLAQTSDGFLRLGWLQGIHFRDSDTVARTGYHRFDSVTGGGERMTMGRIVRHLLGYYDQLGAPPATNPDWVAHTNLVYHATQNPMGWINLDNVTTTPFVSPGTPNGSMRTDRYIVRETHNLWTTIQSIAKNEFFVAYFTKNNELHYKRHPMFDVVPPTPVMTFDESFCIGKPVVDIRNDIIYQVKLHAVQDNGTTLHSNYPASITHVYGDVDEITYIRCNDQDTLDWWAEVQYGWRNRPYTVTWTAPGLAGLLFELHDPVYITYTGTTANGVHIDWTAQKFWIRQIRVDPMQGFTGRSTFVLEADYGMAP